MDASDKNITCCVCSKCVNGGNEITCTCTQCTRCFCGDCTNTNTLSPCCIQEWLCTECSASQSGKNVTEPPQPSSDTYEQNPEFVKLVSEIRRLSRGLMSIKNKLKEATLSVTNCQDKSDVLDSQTSAESRLKTLEKRTREIELLRYTVKELRKELRTKNQRFVLNNIEASLATSMKIFCALHIMQQKKK